MGIGHICPKCKSGKVEISQKAFTCLECGFSLNFNTRKESDSVEAQKKLKKTDIIRKMISEGKSLHEIQAWFDEHFNLTPRQRQYIKEAYNDIISRGKTTRPAQLKPKMEVTPTPKQSLPEKKSPIESEIERLKFELEVEKIKQELDSLPIGLEKADVVLKRLHLYVSVMRNILDRLADVLATLILKEATKHESK